RTSESWHHHLRSENFTPLRAGTHACNGAGRLQAGSARLATCIPIRPPNDPLPLRAFNKKPRPGPAPAGGLVETAPPRDSTEPQHPRGPLVRPILAPNGERSFISSFLHPILSRSRSDRVRATAACSTPLACCRPRMRSRPRNGLAPCHLRDDVPPR